MSTQEEKYYKVLEAALALDIREGHLKWKMISLSRKSKVNRTWIYYMFGRSKQSILENAIQLFGSELAGITPDRMKNWHMGDLTASIHKNRELFLRIPTLPSFYFLYRNRKDQIEKLIRLKEKQLEKKVKSFFPNFSDDFIRVFIAILFGFSFNPNLKETDLPIAEKLINVFLKN